MPNFGEAKAPGAFTGPLVSVVTPFYNTAAFLEQAIRSVIAQTYDNFEYILCDNCSSDGSLEIARRYAAEDSRIRLITHDQFVAQLPNYNRALRCIAAESKYCKIVQADDWIFPNCLAEMINLAEANPQVGIVSCCFLVSDKVAGHGLPFEQTVFSGAEACRTQLLKGGTYFGSPTCLLFRSDIIRNRDPFFIETERNADTTACLEILSTVDFARVPQILAFLRRGNASTRDRLQALGNDAFVNFALVERYGPRYLTPEELQERRNTLESSYLRSLAHALLLGKGREFWEFHRAAFASLGRKLPRARIAAYFLDLILDKLLNPRRTFEALVRRGRLRGLFGGPPSVSG
jgi:glycosyltransferase involved in cell wall biosynthesis